MTETQRRACLTALDISEETGFSLPTVRNIMNRADFPAIRYGRRIIVPREAFEKWLAETAAKGQVNLKASNIKAAYGR